LILHRRVRLIDDGHRHDVVAALQLRSELHASSTLSTLGVRDRTRAVLEALESGYI
jgi:DNA-binding NarL/FixJ family response regulator